MYCQVLYVFAIYSCTVCRITWFADQDMSVVADISVVVVLSAPPVTFKSLLKRLQKKHFPTVHAFAHALGIVDPSRLSRGKPFNVYWCLRLAQVTGENPSVILRAADKGDVATLIETLYGTGKVLLTPEQQVLLDAADAMTPRARQALIAIAQEAAGQRPQGQGGAGSSGEPGLPPPATPEKGPDYKMAHIFQRRARTR